MKEQNRAAVKIENNESEGVKLIQCPKPPRYEELLMKSRKKDEKIKL